MELNKIRCYGSSIVKRVGLAFFSTSVKGMLYWKACALNACLNYIGSSFLTLYSRLQRPNLLDSLYGGPTKYFAILEPQHESIDVSELQKVRWMADFQALIEAKGSIRKQVCGIRSSRETFTISDRW